MNDDNKALDIHCAVNDKVLCFAISSDYVVWATAQTHCLFLCGRSAQEPQLLAELGLLFCPCYMTASGDGCLLCIDEAGCVDFFVIERGYTAPGTNSPLLKSISSASEEDDDAIVAVQLSSWSCGAAVESYTASRRWSIRLRLSAVPTHAAMAPDGSVAALSTPDFLVLVLTDTEGEGFMCEGSEFVVSVEGEVRRCVFVPCQAWFGAMKGCGTVGCVRTCFVSADRLCALSINNHLISLQPHLRDPSQPSASLLRDGHVISQVHGVLSMSVSSVRESLLVLGLSNGSVLLLEAERLEVFKVLDMGCMLETTFLRTHSCGNAFNGPLPRGWPRASEGLKSNPEAHGKWAHALAQVCGSAVLDVAVGVCIVVVTPHLIVYLDKHSYLISEGGVQWLAGTPDAKDADGPGLGLGEGAQARCAPDGSWAWTSALSTILHYCPLCRPSPRVKRHVARYPCLLLGGEGVDLAPLLACQDGEVDLVHAQKPLPPAWLSNDATSLLYPTQSSTAVTRPLRQRVKGSNYAEAPWSVQQEREQRRKKRLALEARRVAPPETAVLIYRPLLPYEAHRLTVMSASNRTLLARAAVHHAVVHFNVFTASGEALVTTSGDRTAYYLRYPVAQHKGEGVFLRAHTASVLSACVNLSLKAPVIATSSMDGIIHLWKPSLREAPLLRYSAAADAGGGEIRVVRFFYLDKFLCHTRANQLRLSRYTLGLGNAGGGGPLLPSQHQMRGRSGSSPCPAPTIAPALFTYSMEAQSITAMDCINHFASTLVVLAGSNKQVCILDLAAEAPARLTSDAHSRGIHHVVMCTGSRFASSSCPLSAQQLFATAGLDNAVYVWDLRQSGPVRQLALHQNRALPTVGLAFSPNGSMLAVGSEDKAVYVYDMGMGGVTPLDILRCSDVPTALAWHPVLPVLAAGLATGELTLFNQR